VTAPNSFRVDHVERDRSGADGELVSPRSGDEAATHLLELFGTFTDERRPVAVELIRDGRAFRRFPVASDGEFAGTASLLGGALDLELRVTAVLADRSRLGFATIRGRRRDGGPTVSVVIPCFRQAHYLEDAIESALAQAVPRLEIVVVDDGSDDNVGQVAARYPGVRYVKQANRGLAAARNTGIREATGDYLVFLDADDRLAAGGLEAGLAQFQEHADAAFAAGHIRNIGPDGSPGFTGEEDVPPDVYLGLLQGCFILGVHSVMFRRSVFKRFGGFDTAIPASADFDLYLRVSAESEVVLHDAIVAEYRRHGANMTRNSALIMETELAVLGAQSNRAFVVRGGRESLESGIRRTKDFHGGVLAERAAQLFASRRFAEALRMLPRLAMHRPRGVGRSLAAGLRLWRASSAGTA
jgi:glycosyltransferase involved in cell wall biosynthesis